MRRHGLRAERCSLVDVTGDSMEPELFDGDSALVDHSRCDPVEGAIFALRTLEGPLVKRLRFHDDRWWASGRSRSTSGRSAVDVGYFDPTDFGASVYAVGAVLSNDT